VTAFGESAFAPTRDGRRLHHVHGGAGSPTVVFESGMGASRCCWALVFADVARNCRAVAYDRAGLGRSPGDPAPRTLDRTASDLVDLLQHLGDGPFVLVGHSYGGLVVRRAAAMVPDVVAGVVLVDASDEVCEVYYSGVAIRAQRASAALLPILARTGVLRIVAARTGRRLPADARSELAAEDSTVGAARTMRRELDPFIEDLTRLRDRPAEPPRHPMTVISGAHRPRFGAATRTALIAAHAHRASTCPGGRHVLAERSGHLVMFSEPEVIVAETLRLVASTRGADAG
jgi:pimeloyl-ACP methyl ester carboxylesterase